MTTKKLLITFVAGLLACLTGVGAARADSPSGAFDPGPPPADVLGSPSNSTLVRSDQLLVSRTQANSGHGPGQAKLRYDSNLWTNDTISFTTEPDAIPLANKQYATAAGRFLSSKGDQVLAFKHLAQDGDATFQLGTVDDAVDTDYTAGDPVTPVVGHTYALESNFGQRLLSANPSMRGAPATMVGPGTGRISKAGKQQQWTVVPVDSGFVQLRDRFDGFCLDVTGASMQSGAEVESYPCIDGGQNQQWKLNGDGSVVSRSSGFYLSAELTSVFQRRFPTSSNAIFHFREVTSPTGVVPTWSDGANADPAIPHDLAAGDLDRAVGADDKDFHDEAVFAYVNDDHTPRVRVVDYNADPGHLTVTEPDKALPAVGGAMKDNGSGGAYAYGSLNVAVGDFDGDGRNEIAVTWQAADASFHASFLRYAATGSQRSLSVVASDVALLTQKDAPTPTLLSGMADLVSGDVDGSGRESLALGYGGSSPDTLGGHTAAFLGVIRFAPADPGVAGSTIHPVAQAIGALTGDGKHGLMMPDLRFTTYTYRGIQLAAGFFKHDEATGFDLHRRTIASVVPTDNLSTGQYPYKYELQITVHEVTTLASAPNVLDLHGQTHAVYYGPWNGNIQSNPISVAAGGFGGLGGPGEIPIWGLAFTYYTGVTQAVVLRIAGADLHETSRACTCGAGVDDFRLTAYDPGGESLVLGAPTVYTINNMNRTDAVAAQPPAHADWLGGKFVNVTRTGELNVQLSTDATKAFDTETTTTTGSTIGVSENSRFSVGDKVKTPFVKFDSEWSIGQKMTKEFENEKDDLQSYVHESTLSMDTETTDDDVIKGQLKTTYVYQYPILNQTLKKVDGTPYTDASCTEKCYGYYAVSVPGRTAYMTGGGRNFDWYQPSWQNGNALSYPDAKGALAADVGSYSYIKDGSTVTTSGTLFDHTNFVDGTSKTESLDVTDKDSVGSTRTSRTTLTNSADTELKASVVAGPGPAKATGSGAVASEFDDSNVLGSITTGQTTTTSADKFALHVPDADANKAYGIRTVYYYDKTGSQRVVHAVDLKTSTQGSAWWSANYGKKADPALNLPDAMFTVKSAGGAREDLKWSDLPNRQLIRGFRAVDAATEVPLVNNPVAGQAIKFAVPVHNYSLKAAGATTIQFYAVPVTDDWLDVVDGKGASPIGDPQTISSISPQGMVDVFSPAWTNPQADGGDDQNYRIFAVLNGGGAADEVHPLHDAEPVCPTDSVDGGGVLTDPMTGKPETLACGQNNQGYGTVTVSPKLPEGGAAPTVQLTETTLVRPGAGNVQAPRGADGVVQAVAGEPLVGLVHASASSHSRAGQPVLVFDGDPAKGRAVATTTMNGVSGASGSTATFSWTPTSPGRHVLHQVLEGRTAEEKPLEQTLTVDVAAHGDATRLEVRLDRATVEPGQPVDVTVVQLDERGNLVGDATKDATLTIAPSGRCSEGTCTPDALGPHTITARLGQLTATAEVQVTRAVGTVKVNSGQQQTAAPGTTFATPITVKVADRKGHRMVSQPVTFSVTRGNAAFIGGKASVTVATDSAGLATTPGLQAGKTVGPVAVRVTSGSVTTQLLAAVSDPSATKADLRLKLSGPKRVHPKQTFKVKIKITNAGPGTAGPSLVSVDVPGGLRIRSHAGGSTSGQVVTYDVSARKKGAKKTFTLKLRATGKGKSTVRAASISGSPDPHPHNNGAHLRVTAKR